MNGTLKLTKRIPGQMRLKLLLICLITLLLLIANTTQAQVLEASVTVEQNIMGFQKGIAINAAVFKNIRLGYFYQATERLSFENDANNYPFHGLSASLPIKRCEGLAVWGGLKSGFVNGNYLIVTPEIVTSFQLSKIFGLGLSMSYRAGHPALGSRITLTL